MTLSSLLTALGITKHPAFWDALYPAAALEYAAQGCVYVSEAFLKALDAEYDAFGECRDVAFATAVKIRENENLMRFIVVLAHAFKDPKSVYADFASIELPPVPDGADPLPYELTAFYGLLSTVHAEARALRARGVPEDILRATVQGHAFSITVFRSRHDRLGYDTGRISWCLNFAPPSNALTIGRFTFAPSKFDYPVTVFERIDGSGAGAERYRVLMRGVKLHRTGLILGSPGCEDEDGAYDADFIEMNTYYEGYPPRPTVPGKPASADNVRIRLKKSEWRVVLQKDDGYLVTHIPERWPFDHETILASYRRAREVYAHCYPDLGIRALHCRTWLLAPQMQGFLKPDANLVRFQNDYILYPCVCNGKAVFSFLFLKPFESYDELPENTTLQREVKKIYLRGEVLYETAGFNFTE